MCTVAASSRLDCILIVPKRLNKYIFHTSPQSHATRMRSKYDGVRLGKRSCVQNLVFMLLKWSSSSYRCQLLYFTEPFKEAPVYYLQVSESSKQSERFGNPSRILFSRILSILTSVSMSVVASTGGRRQLVLIIPQLNLKLRFIKPAHWVVWLLSSISGINQTCFV